MNLMSWCLFHWSLTKELLLTSTRVFHPTLRFDHEHTTATFGTVVRKYNTHTAETHMLSPEHTHTHTHEQLVCSQDQQCLASPRSSITSWLPPSTTKDRVTGGSAWKCSRREREIDNKRKRVVEPLHTHFLYSFKPRMRALLLCSPFPAGDRGAEEAHWWVPVKGPHSLIPC